jgi:predicted methyltransferase
LGRYLASLENKARHAIDVSGVSRDKARALGALAYAPGEITAVGTDLATCLSVIQHCNRDSVKVIFADAFRALRQGGHFYVNGVQAGAGTNDGDQWELLRRARFSHSLEVSSGIAEEAGFKVHGVHTHKVGSLHVWVLCLVKP